MNVFMLPQRARVRETLRSDAGQVLPIVALFMIVLFGMAALAIDVSRAYADLRFYRATADAASLAGAQDLQVVNSRNVTSAEQDRARTNALESLEGALDNGEPSGCGPTSADIIGCSLPGTPYEISIQTPSPSCSTCDPERSVQVTVRQPNYGLTFARVLGSDEWDVGTTSVSGLVYGAQYAVITLRPPKKLGATFDVKDIVLNGTGTTLTVRNGDIGTNANMELNGLGADVNLDSGFKVFHFDSPAAWCCPGNYDPDEKKINQLIKDPNYAYPSFAGADAFTDARSASARSDATDPACAAEVAKVDPATYPFITTTPLDKIFCYNPGIYDSSGGPNPARLRVLNDEVALLRPGAFWLRRGVDIRNPGRLIGGYEAGRPGVALVFDECANTQCNFDGTAAALISLNRGTVSGGNATAAIDWAGNPVVTSGPSSPTPPLIMTVLVLKDPLCYVPTSAPWQEPSSCNASVNQTINMAGGGSLFLIGVQYAPTDNLVISGGSSGTGEVGQIISWTLTYAGGTRINQQYPGGTGNGVLRIDAACSGPNEPCNP